MKLSILNKTLWSGALALSIATLSSLGLPAAAQTDTTVPDTETDVVESEDDGFDWGLLGLLGLLGLAGLARKPEERTVYRDPNVDPATSGRSDYTNLR